MRIEEEEREEVRIEEEVREEVRIEEGIREEVRGGRNTIAAPSRPCKPRSPDR